MSQMYDWVEKDGATWNPLHGACLHDCQYCYKKNMMQRSEEVQRCYTGEIRLNTKALMGSPGNGTIFVCSMNDLFAEGVPGGLIESVLEHCRAYPDNTYLIQTKNPRRLIHFRSQMPPKTILGTTIETNRDYPVSKAPIPYHRAMNLASMNGGTVKMISIEPIMDFDLEYLAMLIQVARPNFVSIGADSKGNDLPEPPARKVKALISELKELNIEVRLKPNLARILEQDGEQ